MKRVSARGSVPACRPHLAAERWTVLGIGREAIYRSTAILLLLVLSVRTGLAQQTPPPSWPPVQSLLDVTNMTTWLRNDGLFPWQNPYAGSDAVTRNVTFPKGTSARAVFTQGVVWGGIVRDGAAPEVRVNGSTYQTGLDPGRVLRDADGNVIGPDEIDLAKYHVWRVHRNWNTTLDYTSVASWFFDVERPAVTEAMRQQLREQYAYDWDHWPAAWGAPFEDVDGDGSYDPAVDIPGHPEADQTLWIVANDLRPGTSEHSHGSPAIGIEYQLTIWGYDVPEASPLDHIHFMQARLIYTGTPETPPDARIDSMFVLLFADPDLGNYTDDFLGYDRALSLAYAYNGNTQDEVYRALDLPPAAVGWDLLRGPVTADGDTLGVHAFIYDGSGSDMGDPLLGSYEGTLQFYNLMRGLYSWPAYPEGRPFIDPTLDEPTRFTVAGDPFLRTGWIDGMQLPPGNRSFWMSTGPLTLALGDTVEVVFAQVGAISKDNLSSLSLLQLHDKYAQFAHDLESAPPPGTATEPPAALPAGLVLHPSYPNPFHKGTWITVELNRPQWVRLAVYDLLGREVARLHDGMLSTPGAHRFRFEGAGLSSGVYLVRAASDQRIATQRIVLVNQ